MDHIDLNDIDDLTTKFQHDFADQAPRHWAKALAKQGRAICELKVTGDHSYEGVCNTTGVTYAFTLEGDSTAERQQLRDAASQLMVLAIISTRE